MEEKEEVLEETGSAINTENQAPQGWRGYISLGTTTLGLLAIYAASQGAILAPIIFGLGALMLMPTIMQAPLKDGTKAGCGTRFSLWFIFFAIGLICLPSQKPATPPTSPTTKPAETQKLKPTSAPTAKPTTNPTSKPIPSTEPDPPKGTMESFVNKPMKEWKKASAEDRLTAAGAMAYGVFKDKSKEPRLIAYAAQELVDCLDKIAEVEQVQENTILEWSSMCAIQMGWTKN